jgi:hypothetical protein
MSAKPDRPITIGAISPEDLPVHPVQIATLEIEAVKAKAPRPGAGGYLPPYNSFPKTNLAVSPMERIICNPLIGFAS